MAFKLSSHGYPEGIKKIQTLLEDKTHTFLLFLSICDYTKPTQWQMTPTSCLQSGGDILLFNAVGIFAALTL